jgi:hypothetical protein
MRWKVLFFLLPILALVQGSKVIAQPGPKLTHYIDLYVSSDAQPATVNANLSGFIQKLDEQKSSLKKDKVFLQHLFAKTHQRFLKRFAEFATFSEQMSRGTYNCLTATALYALLVDHFGYAYQIIETNYHIFLVVATDEGQFLFEATDPVNGFTDNAADIEKKISFYKENAIGEKRGKTCYRFNFELYNVVSLDEMVGLMHYNQAIKAFNDHQLPMAVSQLDIASELYHSPRIEEFSKIVLLSVLESKLETILKEECVKKLQSVRKRMMPAMARAGS